MLFNFIYSFHMPLFMCLSGFVNYKPNIKLGLIRKRFLQLIVPFVSFNFVNAVLTGKDILCYFKSPQLGLWFLWVLFFITTLQICICNICYKIKISENLLTLISFCIFSILCNIFHTTIFAIDMIIYFWLYYIIGFFLRKYNIILSNIKNSVVSLLTFFFIVFSLTYNRVEVPHVFSFIPHALYCRIVPIVCIIALIILFKRFCDCKVLALNALGGVTLGVYAVHLQFFVWPDLLHFET